MGVKQPWFRDKWFIVTGGSSGIGLAITQELLAYGAKVMVLSNNPNEFQPAKEACAKIPSIDERLQFFKCDISNLEDIIGFKTQIEDKRGNLVGLINNAGITTYGPFFKTPTNSINRLLQINFVGTMLFTREIFPLCLSPVPGKKDVRYLTFTSSTSAIVPFAYVGGYPGTKAGVEMALRSIELELPSNVKILFIRPGPVKTALYDSAKTAPGADTKQIVEFSSKGTTFSKPAQIARPLVRAIIKKKAGAMYPDIKTAALFGLMRLPLLGELIVQWVSKELRKRFEDS